MSFTDWKKRSKRYHDMMAGHGIGRVDAEEVAQAAYKAGERDGRKLAEAEGMKLAPLYAIPDGWALVPKEPTKEMMQAGFDVKGSHLYGLTWSAMLDAAPKTPNLLQDTAAAMVALSETI